jgi:hypothetical protein
MPSKKAKGAKKVAEMSVVESINSIVVCVGAAQAEAEKFDERAKGWKPAGARIRKQLQNIIVAARGLRKQISAAKNMAE